MFLTLIKSFARFFASEIRKVASQMREEYQNDIMGKVAVAIYNNNNNNNLFYSVIVVIISHSVCDATCKCRVGRSIRRSLSAYGSSITKYNFHFTV